MIYGYIRVSTDKQTIQNQKFEIEEFILKKSYKIDSWIEETISGTKKLSERKLGKLLKRMTRNDTLIVTELSRLGRNLMQIMGILHFCMEREIRVRTIKEQYELGNNINSKVLAFAFGLSAEIERNLISSRTKEALARKRAEGVILGRPKERKSTKLKLNGKEDIIKTLISQKNSKISIARKLKVQVSTLNSFIEKKGLLCGYGGNLQNSAQ